MEGAQGRAKELKKGRGDQNFFIGEKGPTLTLLVCHKF